MSLQTLAGPPYWNDGGERRLYLSLVAAAAIVFAALSLLRWPDVVVLEPLVELVVRIAREESAADIEAASEPLPVERPAGAPPLVEPVEPDPAAEETQSAEPASGASLVGESPPAAIAPALAAPGVPAAPEPARRRPSWEEAGAATIGAFLDEQAKTESMNPELDALRESNSERYRPRTIPLPKPIWENAEPDQLGRTVLRHGDCFKVLDDPNVGRRDQFETFDQYIVQCMFQRRPPQELPWVKDIRERYLYLSDPDGYLKGSPDDPAVKERAGADQE